MFKNIRGKQLWLMGLLGVNIISIGVALVSENALSIILISNGMYVFSSALAMLISSEW